MSDVWLDIEQDESGKPIQIGIDPDGIPVFLSHSVWFEHILKHHPEMADYKDLILQAVTNPVQREFEDSEGNFIRAYADIPPERQPTASKLRVRVVVKYLKPPERDNQRTGLVSSAYLVRQKAV